MKRLLWIKTSPLHPLTRGGDLRTYHLLKWLNCWHEVTFCGMTADPAQESAAKLAGEYCRQSTWVSEAKVSQSPNRFRFLAGALLNLVSPLPYAVDRFRSRKWQGQIQRLLEERDYDAVVCDFIFPAASLPWDLKSPKDRWVVFQHNVESLIWKRRSDEAGTLMRPYLTAQWRRMEAFEKRMCERFDAVLTVSDEDSRLSRELYGLRNVAGAVPTGVDLDYFTAVPRNLPPTPTVVFVGSMDWYANVDAVLHFVRDIWPRVRKEYPDAVFKVVGRNPPEHIRALAASGQGIEVTGTVPDVRPFMREAHAMVVPLRIGGGTRLKVFEAMAAGIPIVSTSIGAEGLQAEDGRHLLLADDPASFAAGLTQLLGNPESAEQMGGRAFDEVAQKNSWERAAKIMEELLFPPQSE